MMTKLMKTLELHYPMIQFNIFKNLYILQELQVIQWLMT